jgi:hypothetical protein
MSLGGSSIAPVAKDRLEPSAISRAFGISVTRPKNTDVVQVTFLRGSQMVMPNALGHEAIVIGSSSLFLSVTVRRLELTEMDAAACVHRASLLHALPIFEGFIRLRKTGGIFGGGYSRRAKFGVRLTRRLWSEFIAFRKDWIKISAKAPIWASFPRSPSHVWRQHIQLDFLKKRAGLVT